MARLAFLVALAAVGADAYAMAGSRRPLVAPRSVVSRTPLVRHGAANTKAVIEGMVPRIIQGATQGAVGAVVAATLSAFTEPVVNRILVQRISVMESIKQLDMAKSRKFFMTTLPTNFLKVGRRPVVAICPWRPRAPRRGMAGPLLALPVYCVSRRGAPRRALCAAHGARSSSTR